MAKTERKENYKNYPDIPTNEKISAEDYNNLVNNLDILQNRENLLETNLKFIEDELFKIMKVYNYYYLYLWSDSNDNFKNYIIYKKLFIEEENKKTFDENHFAKGRNYVYSFNPSKNVFKYVFWLYAFEGDVEDDIKIVVLTISGDDITWEEKIIPNIKAPDDGKDFHLDFCFILNSELFICGRYKDKTWLYFWDEDEFVFNSPNYNTTSLISNDEKSIDNCIGLTYFDGNKFFYYTIYNNTIYKISCEKTDSIEINDFTPNKWESEKIYSGSNVKNFVIGLDEKLKFVVGDNGWKTMNNTKLEFALNAGKYPFLIFYSVSSLYQTIPKEMIIDTSTEEVFKNWLTTAAGLYDLGYDQFKDVADMNNNTGKFKENLDKIMNATNGTMDLFKIVNKKTNICFVVFTRKEDGNSYLSFIVGDNETGKIFYEKSSHMNFQYYNNYMGQINSINNLFKIFDELDSNKDKENDVEWLKFFIDGFIGFDVDK